LRLIIKNQNFSKTNSLLSFHFPMTTKTTYDKAQIHEDEPIDELSPTNSDSSCLTKTSKKITKNSSRKKIAKACKRLWTPLEDRQLLNLLAIHGNKWTLIGDLIGGRSCKQVRDRYLNYLNPEVKTTPFSSEEDEELISLFHQFGRKWKMIANQMIGRSESQVKNRFYRHLICKLNDEDEKNMFDIKRIECLGNSSNVDTEACSTPESTILSQQLPCSMKPTYSFLQAEFFNNESSVEKMNDLQQISFENSSRNKVWDVEHFFSSVNPAVETRGTEADFLEGGQLGFVKMNSIN